MSDPVPAVRVRLDKATTEATGTLSTVLIDVDAVRASAIRGAR